MNIISRYPSPIACATCLFAFAVSVLLTTWNSPVYSQENGEFPYTLVVSQETADVLSGPGKTHYATDRLPKGTKVEIYRHDPGGYYAIRPPKGSFSLVLASAVKPTADANIVEVDTASAKAWIGSRLQGNFKPMWQLKLKSGELLNVVRKVQIAGAHSATAESWYQVEPPRGEFRWIHKDALGPQAPASVSTAEIASQQIDLASREVDLMNQLGAARTQADISSTGRGGWKVLETDPSRKTNISANEAFFEDSTSSIASLSSFDEKINAVDLALSQMVLAPKQQWQLGRLQTETDRLRKEATTGKELAEANQLALKILSFQKIQAGGETSSDRSYSRTASLMTPNLNQTASQNDLGGIRYDGRGILRKLYTNGGVGQAIYALEDEQGKVVKTITPSNGVNLERFIGKSVGLFGKSGFNQKLNRPHLTAQRVVDLNKIR